MEPGFDGPLFDKLLFGMPVGTQVVALGYRDMNVPIFLPNEVKPFAPFGVEGSREVKQNTFYTVFLFHIPSWRKRYKIIPGGNSLQGRYVYIIVLNVLFVKTGGAPVSPAVHLDVGKKRL